MIHARSLVIALSLTACAVESEPPPSKSTVTAAATADKIAVKDGCTNNDINQGGQVGDGPLYKPPGIFQNNGKPSGVDQTEQNNAGLLNGMGSLKCLHGGPGSTGQPLPTGDQIGGMTKPVIDSICFAASSGANGCSVLAVECAQTSTTGNAADGQVMACTGSVYVTPGGEYCDGQWYGCDGNPVGGMPKMVGGLQLTQGNGVPKDGVSKCGGGDDSGTGTVKIDTAQMFVMPDSIPLD